MNFAFFGTDEFAIGVLATLAKNGLVPELIITTPDRPRGRKLILTPPPVKLWAKKHNIEFIQPASLKNDPEAISPACRQAGINYQLFIVASYGKIIPPAIFNLPRRGTLNIHPSLLPKYRGATPIEAAILAGDETSGVTIIQIDETLDHGPIVAKQAVTLTGQEYYEELRDRLAIVGGQLLVDILPRWLSGALSAAPQTETLATYTKLLEKENGLINFADPPELTYRKIRAYTPWPGTFFFWTIRGESFRVVIKKAHLKNKELVIDRVVPAGKKEVAWADLIISDKNRGANF